MSRLPIPGGDEGTWGPILNDFLSQALDTDGTLLPSSVTEAKLAPGVVAKLNSTNGVAISNTPSSTSQVLTATGSTSAAWATPNFVDLTTNQVVGGAKTFSSSFTISDVSDATKQVHFALSGITTGTTRTLTIPDASGTILLSNTAVTVAQGGTGRTSTTAYALLAGGTTTTGALQPISNGTTGQFLKSAGTSALPVMANITEADVTNLTTDLATKMDKVTSTDAALVRFTGTNGSVQNSTVTLGSNGVFTSNATTFGIGVSLGAGSSAAVIQRNGTGQNLLEIASSGLTNSSGTQSALLIDPVINQTGTANYNGIYVNLTETNVGSGNKFLINLAISTASKFAVDDNGNVTTAGTINGLSSASAMGTVIHGSTASTARPTGYTVVTWIGTVAPTNALINDIWIDKS